jgi:hypothetical protein
MLLDIEFLEGADGASAADMRPIVYVYRSGALRSRMKKCVAALAARFGLVVGEYLPSEVSSYRPAGFFDEYRLCDWPKERQPKETVAFVGDILASGKATALAVFTPRSGPLLDHAAWGAIEKHCLVLHEADISKHTLERYLRFCDRTTDLLPSGTLLRQDALQGYFEDVRSGATISVAELIQRFDELALTRVDSHSFELAPVTDDEEVAGGPPALLRGLRELVTKQELSALIAIAQVMDLRQQQGRTVDQRHIELYQKTGAMIRPKARSMYGDAGVTDVLLWCAMLLAWDKRLSVSGANGRRMPEIFGVGVDQMCRDFLMRFGSQPVDPLVGIWPLLQDALDLVAVQNERGLPRVRRRFLMELSTALTRASTSDAPAWVGRLHVLMKNACAMFDAETIVK